MNTKLSPLEQQVLKYIKEHKIKNNQILAKILDTTPGTIAVIKNRLISKGVISPEEALERVFRKNKKKQQMDYRKKTDFIDLLFKRS